MSTDETESATYGLWQRINEIDPSSRSNSKYRPVDKYIELTVGVQDADAYCATVDLARNISVRFEQSERARKATLLVLVVSSNLEFDLVSQIEDTLVDYLSRKRPHAEGMVLQVEGDRIIVRAVAHPPGTNRPYLSPFISTQTDVRQSIESRWRKTSLGELRFVITDADQPVDLQTYPYAVLRRDQWDDFGIKSLFHLTLHLHPSSQHAIGSVKIGQLGQTSGRTIMPDNRFRALSTNYFSLGQNFSYYENLKLLGSDVYERVLRGLRDTVLDQTILSRAQGERVWSDSLLRMSSAERALLDAPSIFSTSPPVSTGEINFAFSTSVGGNWFDTNFAFSNSSPLPSRVNAIIGYNGSGKTQLLANLALAATSKKGPEKSSPKHGSISSATPVLFSSVITVSYSAFDTFTLPDQMWGATEQHQATRQLADHGEVFGYAYFGLREKFDSTSSTDTKENQRLKSIDSIREEFSAALRSASTPRRRPVLSRALSILFQDPSFGRPGIVQELEVGQVDPWIEYFDNFSTGHKIVLNVITQLISRCDPKSLVLIDEPESHLHPSLLAAFLQALTTVLNEFDSYAVVTTHSPVVLQEIPKKYVQIISRFGNSTQITTPTGETFGENVATLTREAFGLDNVRSDYHSVLERLALDLSLVEIEELFDGELSGNARAYLLTLFRRKSKRVR